EGYTSLLNLSRRQSQMPVSLSPADPNSASRFEAPQAVRPVPAPQSPSVFAIPAQPEAETPREHEAALAPRTPVRAFDPPHATARDAEADLRAALAALQRMSGAA